MYAFIASKHQSILSVKEKMYTKTEVIDLISDFIKCKDGLNQNFDIKYHNKWIDQNL